MVNVIDLCFLCTKEYNCVPVDRKIVSQVEYLLPEITIIKLGVPLRICPNCDGALCAFSKFKQSSMESSRRLEAHIKGAQGPPLHTGGPPVVDDRETSGTQSEKMEEIFIKEEYVEETPLDTNRAFLDPISLSETISAEPHNQLHKDWVSQNIQLHTDTNAGNIEEILIKEEQIEETPQGSKVYNKILKEEFVSNSVNEDTDRQPEHNTHNTSAALNTNEKVLEGSSDSKEEIQFVSITKSFSCFSCEICGKTLMSKSSLISHTQIHFGEKNFQCNVCNKSFSHKHNLTSHMKIHSDKKDFQCEICKKAFTYKCSLNYHMKLHSGIKEFQCDICGRSFTHKSNLTSHVYIHSRKRFK